MFASRVTIAVGHFGSGKTEIAVNGAARLAGGGERVALVDLDVVKPYFRSRSARSAMARLGVEVIAPTGEHAHADLPIVVPEVRRLLRDPETRVVMDVGGDPVGTRALGSVSDAVPVGETELLLVLNFRRPYTETVDDAVVMAREIEDAARLRVSGLVSNTHLLDETTPEVVVDGYRLAAEAAKRLDLPLVAVVCEDSLRPEVVAQAIDCEVFGIERSIAPPFERPRLHGRIGPVFALN